MKWYIDIIYQWYDHEFKAYTAGVPGIGIDQEPSCGFELLQRLERLGGRARPMGSHQRRLRARGPGTCTGSGANGSACGCPFATHKHLLLVVSLP